MIKQKLVVSAASAFAMAIGVMIPAMAAWLEQGTLARTGCAVLLVAFGFMLVAIFAMWRAMLRTDGRPFPAPVLMAILGNIFFLSFCALELSDRLIRQEGRIFYWTSFLLLPALVVLGGQIWPQRWAWWVLRLVTALACLWFLAFIAIAPFAVLRGHGGPPPWWGRIYVAGVSLVFAGVSFGMFRALGRVEARDYFQMRPQR